MSIAENLEIIAENIPKVYEAGKKSEYDTFWDEYQSNGNRTDYNRAFCYLGWTNENFKPKYVIKPKDATQLFYRASKLVGEVEGVINCDFSECTNFTQTFQDMSKITRIGILDMRKATTVSNTCVYCSELVTVDKIIMNETTTSPGFVSDTKLTNVTFEGVIGRNISFSASPLSVASMKSLITHLKDYNGSSEYSCTLTLKSSAFSALEAEGATAEYNGVACTWEELVDNKKWNLTLAS